MFMVMHDTRFGYRALTDGLGTALVFSTRRGAELTAPGICEDPSYTIWRLEPMGGVVDTCPVDGRPVPPQRT